MMLRVLLMASMIIVAAGWIKADAIKSRVDAWLYNPPIAADIKVDPSEFLHIHTREDVALTRMELLAAIFGNSALDTGLMPTSTEPADLLITGIDAEVSEPLWLVLDQGQGFVAKSLFLPAESQCLFIFGDGHAEQILHPTNPISYPLVDRAYELCDVLVVSMPMRGHNQHRMGTHKHDALANIHSAEFHPMQLFLSHILSSLNHLTAAKNYDVIAMAGISGGGWTTTMYAAIDPRIDVSVSIAGSWPMYLREVDARSLGDWEQLVPDIYAISSYLDLYAMAAEGREHIHIFNVHDDCCFSGTSGETYRPLLETRAVALSGSFSMHFDYTAVEHEITEAATEITLSALRAALIRPR